MAKKNASGKKGKGRISCRFFEQDSPSSATFSAGRSLAKTAVGPLHQKEIRTQNLISQLRN
ncbi:hypothetical protein ASD36_11610 [Rhizobium sp. Root1334]|nr:hypothetical protein ASD36_11610 [Rhizobium sp. Root1334]